MTTIDIAVRPLPNGIRGEQIDKAVDVVTIGQGTVALDHARTGPFIEERLEQFFGAGRAGGAPRAYGRSFRHDQNSMLRKERAAG